MTKRFESVLGTAHMSPAELSAARLDGDIFPVGPSYLAWGYDDSSRSRALALCPHIPRGLIVEAQTALWVYGFLRHFPSKITLCTPVKRRRRASIKLPHTVREVLIAPHQIHGLCGLAVLSPLRLACDTLMANNVATLADKVAFRLLCLTYSLSMKEIDRALATSGHPRRNIARQRLASLV
ncbi:hypothetical protein [Lysinibacter sp. HNR]|uniref:hypothetical protein n=1 Tax=Lysinibacter sp. HNR TaxID=3031408 RepID=UPI00243511FB|nr:hypothetical protein [Lysinibacter sp. HNR]WGD36302.1 hypothetical protein FrondiHNR_07355 [Lysinibacter sp. HNR]